MNSRSRITKIFWSVVIITFVINTSQSIQASSPIPVEYEKHFSFKLDDQPLILLPPSIILDTIAECETKDFVIIVYNPNATSIRIDSALFGGSSQSEFFLRTPKVPLTIQPHDSMRMTVRLAPTSVGSKNATLKFLTQNLNLSSNTISIHGDIKPASLGYSPIGINFGPLNIFQTNDQRIYLVNTGTKDVLVTRLSIVGSDTAMFHIINNTAPFVLKPGESFEVIVRFSPTIEGEFGSFLQVNSNDCNGLVTVISMNGVGAVGTIAKISIPDVRGKPGSKVLIPVSMLNQIIDNPSNGFSLLFKYNATTLLPLDVHFLNTNRFGYNAKWKLYSPGQMQIDVNGTMPISDSGVVINIIAEVFLGDAASFPLELQSFIFKDKHPYNITSNGMFYLDSICQIPRQLIRQKSNAVLFQNHPNPSHAFTFIDYKLNHDSFVRLKILDQLGREFQILVNEYQTKGMHSIQVDLSSMKSGNYFYRLETSDEILIKQMTLLR